MHNYRYTSDGFDFESIESAQDYARENNSIIHEYNNPDKIVCNFTKAFLAEDYIIE